MLEQLLLRHEMQRAVEDDAHRQWIQVVNMVADEDGGAVFGQMVGAFDGPVEVPGRR